LLLSITTAGFDRNSICYEQYCYAKKVMADWKFDPTFFALIFEPDEGDDWADPATWPKANPSWGVTIDPKDFAAEVREAQSNVRKQAAFQRYRLNIWTQANTRWLSADAWASAAAPPPESLDGRDCWLGLDLAYSLDTSSAVLLFPSSDGSVDVLPRFYLPQDGMAEREKRDGVPYSAWIKAGYIVATDSETTDYEFIRADIEALSKRYCIRRIGMDPWQAIQLGNQLQGLGLDVFKYPQGFRGFNSPCRQLENLLSNGKLRHDGNPVLAFHAGNVTIRQNAEGMIRPLKPTDNNNARVDGVISLLQAIGTWSSEEQTPPKPKPRIHVL
jgi:phage terminase large subunit-like protein